LFVTWKKWHSTKKEWRLRGCKGTFSSLPLSKGLYDFALNRFYSPNLISKCLERHPI
jgi:AMMECR1 domain-containing protein